MHPQQHHMGFQPRGPRFQDSPRQPTNMKNRPHFQAPGSRMDRPPFQPGFPGTRGPTGGRMPHPGPPRPQNMGLPWLNNRCDINSQGPPRRPPMNHSNTYFNNPYPQMGPARPQNIGPQGPPNRSNMNFEPCPNMNGNRPPFLSPDVRMDCPRPNNMAPKRPHDGCSMELHQPSSRPPMNDNRSPFHSSDTRMNRPPFNNPADGNRSNFPGNLNVNEQRFPSNGPPNPQNLGPPRQPNICFDGPPNRNAVNAQNLRMDTPVFRQQGQGIRKDACPPGSCPNQRMEGPVLRQQGPGIRPDMGPPRQPNMGFEGSPNRFPTDGNNPLLHCPDRRMDGPAFSQQGPGIRPETNHRMQGPPQMVRPNYEASNQQPGNWSSNIIKDRPSVSGPGYVENRRGPLQEGNHGMPGPQDNMQMSRGDSQISHGPLVNNMNMCLPPSEEVARRWNKLIKGQSPEGRQECFGRDARLSTRHNSPRGSNYDRYYESRGRRGSEGAVDVKREGRGSSRMLSPSDFDRSPVRSNTSVSPGSEADEATRRWNKLIKGHSSAQGSARSEEKHKTPRNSEQVRRKLVSRSLTADRRGTKRTRDRDSESEDRKKRHSSVDDESPKSSKRKKSGDVPKKSWQEEEERKLMELMEGKKKKKKEVADDAPTPAWVRSAPAPLYFKLNLTTGNHIATERMKNLENRFDEELVQRAAKMREGKPKYEPPPRPQHVHCCNHNHDDDSSSCSSSEDEDEASSNRWMEELNRKREHPERLHPELWFNEKGEMNDGPLCRCSRKARRGGIRHDIYIGETPLPLCNPDSTNADKLYHYWITMSPHTNFLSKHPTTIEYDGHEYIFEGFSLFTHHKIGNVPLCKVVRFNIEYTIHWFEEEMPTSFSVRSLDLFTDFLYREMLELLDLDWLYQPSEEACRRLHLMPRFARSLPDNGKELLSMNEVLQYLMNSSKSLLEEEELENLHKYEQHEWQRMVDEVRGMLVTRPGMRPAALRVDQLDREQSKSGDAKSPLIIHFGIRPAQLSYAGDPNYLRLWKQYVKFRHLLANKPKVTDEDRHKLQQKEDQLQEMRIKGNLKREVTVELSSEGFIRTGIRSDICQHALLAPVLIQHLRFHRCLDELEKTLQYSFQDRTLVQYALTHPSYRVNYGTNPDHARNSVSNCGVRQPEYGDRSIHYVRTRKRGINILISIMAKLGEKDVKESQINHYERLEFLGDAVVEFLSSIHLYFMFPALEEGGLATYRAALVQNQHLAILAEKLHLEDFMLYAHGPDLCHTLELKHAMANCFEGLLGALLLDGGIEVANDVFANTLFAGEDDLASVWKDMPAHPLQEEEPNGDRHWIANSPVLQKMVKFEEMTGIEFTHIRLLARAFTLRNVSYNTLTLGHNQRMEFLGDTILQLICSEYLYNHFPEHHEGHLSLLRSSLVSNKTQAVISEDLGMMNFVIEDPTKSTKTNMRLKDKADLLEAFIGALYVDKGLQYCQLFCNVCFFPRLYQFIVNQDWNDPKSRLQQCCLTLRELDSCEPDTPIYRVLEVAGPTNVRQYKVAVYFQDRRLAVGYGASIQNAEMDAATNALSQKSYLFPQLSYQKNFIEKKFLKMTSAQIKNGKDTHQRAGDQGKSPGKNQTRNRRSQRRSQRGKLSAQNKKSQETSPIKSARDKGPSNRSPSKPSGSRYYEASHRDGQGQKNERASTNRDTSSSSSGHRAARKAGGSHRQEGQTGGRGSHGVLTQDSRRGTKPRQ